MPTKPKNAILTFFFAFIPGAGQMYQGYMKRGLSLILMAVGPLAVSGLFDPFAYLTIIVWMYAFFDTFNLRAQIAAGQTVEDDYLVHIDTKDKRLIQMSKDSHRLLGWSCIALGVLMAYSGILMPIVDDVVWRWGQNSPFFRAVYLVLSQLPQIVVCVILIVCGVWLVRGPRVKSAEPTDSEAEDFHAYTPVSPEIRVDEEAEAAVADDVPADAEDTAPEAETDVVDALVLSDEEDNDHDHI